MLLLFVIFFFVQAEDGIRDSSVTGVQTCALPIWFDIGGYSLFDPMMVFVHGGKSQVNHFVGQHPVRGKFRRNSLVAEAYGDSSSSIAKCHAVADPSSFEKSDSNQDSRHGKAAIIGRHGLSGRFNPEE